MEMETGKQFAKTFDVVWGARVADAPGLPILRMGVQSCKRFRKMIHAPHPSFWPKGP